MIYTKLTYKAMKLAFEAHKNQVDKSGIPYVHHPLHVAESMDDEYSTIVALLHDVVEDTDVTLEYLYSEFPKEAVDAIALMTHERGVPYLDYVRKIKTNPIATKVKLSDLAHNMDTTRLDVITQKDLNRLEKYKKAKKILEE